MHRLNCPTFHTPLRYRLPSVGFALAAASHLVIESGAAQVTCEVKSLRFNHISSIFTRKPAHTNTLCCFCKQHGV